MVFQHFNLFPHRSVLENLTEAPMLVDHLKRSEIEPYALELLDKVGLADKAGSYPSRLSGRAEAAGGHSPSPCNEAGYPALR